MGGIPIKPTSHLSSCCRILYHPLCQFQVKGVCRFLKLTKMEERIYENVPSLCGSISHSNLRDIAVCERQDHPEIVEVPSHYDVPRIHSRSQSLSGLNTWSTHRLDTGSIGESSSSPLSDNSVEFQSASVPGSPQSSCKDCGQIDPIMSNRDWSIYNSLGSSSSKEGKVC